MSGEVKDIRVKELKSEEAEVKILSVVLYGLPCNYEADVRDINALDAHQPQLMSQGGTRDAVMRAQTTLSAARISLV